MEAAPLDPPVMGAPAAAPAPRAQRRARRPSRDERRLARGLRRGDEAALADVYSEFGGTTFAYLLRTLGDRAAAEDVQQQIFLEVWQRGRSFDPKRGTLLAWILTIARSRAIDHLRRRVPEPVEDVDDAAHGPVDDAPADELLEQWRVAHYLRRLRPEESAVLRMRFYHDLSQSEIAEQTGIPLGTVKMRMVQALDRLRSMIEVEEGIA
jgi:RNA polymerase sigma-70 factor (ECF subfamily)